MPFANLSGDPEQEYFADGMVAEITTLLSRFKSIFVIASSSTLSFKGQSVSAQEAACQLGVSFVLEGSVRKSANRVRIAVQLIDGADGRQMWADRFEDGLEDIFALQDKVALSIAGKIEPTVQASEIRRASTRQTDLVGSYDLCLRAFPRIRTLDRDGLAEGLELANRAIAIDPGYGLALVLAAICRMEIDFAGWADDPAGNRRQAIEAARQALKAEPDDALVVAFAASVLGYLERDMQVAVALADKALMLNPGHERSWHTSADMRRRSGDADTAIEHIEAAMRLDPIGPDRPMQLYVMAIARFAQSRFSDAISLAKEAIQQIDDSPMGHALLAASYGHLGQQDDAAHALERYEALTPQSIDAFARWLFLDPAQLKLALDGIGLAAGKRPLAVPTGV
jgi:adenylate cyclase